MSNLKDKVASTFEKIQYESEDLIASLQSKVDDSEVGATFLKLKNATSRKIGQTLNKVQKELRQLNEVDEISGYLDEAGEYFSGFFSEVREKANLLERGENIDDYLGELKDETGDTIDKLAQQAKQKVKDAKLDEKFDSLKEKGEETYDSLKEKGGDTFEDLKSKTEDLTKEAREKSEDFLSKMKEKLGK